MLIKQIRDRINNINGNIGIYYKDIRSGYSCYEGNSDLFAAAGIAKLFLSIEVFKQLEEEIINKDTKYVLKNSDKAPSIGAILNLHEGIELTIEDLYKMMVSVGDNSAFNILSNIVGIDKINKTLSDMGLITSRIRRLFFDQESIDRGIENHSSVREIGDIFERLYYGQIISNKASQEMINLFMLQQRNYIIPYYFNEYTPISHQLGEDEGIIHDAGIIFSKNPFILCMSADNVDVRKVESAMRDIALMCMKNSNKFN
jgi:beta-lactamase class A